MKYLKTDMQRLLTSLLCFESLIGWLVGPVKIGTKVMLLGDYAKLNTDAIAGIAAVDDDDDDVGDAGDGAASNANNEVRCSVKPLFLTNKFRIAPLSARKNVYDFQLRDHFLNKSNLFVLQCRCSNHKHNKRPCIIVPDTVCGKCKTPTKPLINFQSMLFHPELAHKQLTRCCRHTHSPPCGRCINCHIGQTCIVPGTFDCYESTDVVCHLNEKQFTKDVIEDNIILHEHIYNTKKPTFYFCFKHKHYHITHPLIPCIIHDFKCCPDAVAVTDYKECFTVTTIRETGNKKSVEWIIFNPAIWREQSFNHFMSFIRAVIISPNDVLERYRRFEKSNFSISNIRRYISGKESIIRMAVTGFETTGIYQTSTISCTIPYYVVVLPQKLYDSLIVEGFDLDLVMVKRDPSILQTCMYVCVVRRNPDPSSLVTTISDQQSKGMNQDQDGDRNAQYFNRKFINGYDATKSFDYCVSKMELANAFRVKRTLVGTPRYILSETSMLQIARCGDKFQHLPFFARINRIQREKNVEFMNEAAAGYLCDEYDEFQEALRVHVQTETPNYITVDDILLNTERLSTIVSSGAKGNVYLIKILLGNISSMNGQTLTDKKKDMIDLCNKYITSSQDLSRNGRKQFAALYAAHDLVSFFDNIYINKVCYASYRDFATAATCLFNQSSLKLFVEDLYALDS